MIVIKTHMGLHVTDPRHPASDPPDQPARKRGRPSTYTKELAERVVMDHPVPDFIKIDVEGAEVKVLIGAENLIRQHKPIFLMEVSCENKHFVSEFLKYGYIFIDAKSTTTVKNPSHNTFFIPFEFEQKLFELNMKRST